tara:strand:- start:1058 stop:1621 length:564 start_codon:yes stop_codon:yes gene_type:complete
MQVENEFIEYLEQAGKQLKQSHVKNLAGEIEKELLFTDHRKIEKYLKPHIDFYIKAYNEVRQPRHQFRPLHKLVSCWINYQKKGEYNPIHLHENCDISWVIYVDVPEEIYDEPKVGNRYAPGVVSFYYGDRNLFNANQYPVKPRTGDMLIFPSFLQHSVQKFDTDVVRTSVAGNTKLTDTFLRRYVQ